MNTLEPARELEHHLPRQWRGPKTWPSDHPEKVQGGCPPLETLVM